MEIGDRMSADDRRGGAFDDAGTGWVLVIKEKKKERGVSNGPCKTIKKGSGGKKTHD